MCVGFALVGDSIIRVSPTTNILSSIDLQRKKKLPFRLVFGISADRIDSAQASKKKRNYYEISFNDPD